MKISKFNDNKEQYKKPTIIWNENNLHQFQILKNKVDSDKYEICRLLSEYLLLNPDILEEFSSNSEIEQYSCYDFNYHKYPMFIYSNVKVKMTIEINDDDYNENLTLYIKEEKFPDFLDFLKDQEQYKNSKKYNI